MKQITTHWRTTATGIATLLGAAALAINLLASGNHHFLSQDWAPVFIGISTGVGLVQASDSKTTDTQHNENAAKIETNAEKIDSKP